MSAKSAVKRKTAVANKSVRRRVSPNRKTAPQLSAKKARANADMIRPTRVEARKGFAIWIEYSDGAAGLADLSHLAGRGVFCAWQNRAFFESVRLSDSGAIVWGDNIDICPDALYMRLTGKANA